MKRMIKASFDLNVPKEFNYLYEVCLNHFELGKKHVDELKKNWNSVKESDQDDILVSIEDLQDAMSEYDDELDIYQAAKQDSNIEYLLENLVDQVLYALRSI